MQSKLNAGDLYRIKSALIDSLPNKKHEELVLTNIAIEKVSEMLNEIIAWYHEEYSTDKEMINDFAKENIN
jgi:hypothetical protein